MLLPREYIVRRKGLDFISCQSTLFPQGIPIGWGCRINYDGSLQQHSLLKPLIFYHKTIWTF